MNLSIAIGRKVKRWFVEYNLHKPLSFLKNPILKFGYLIEMSEWCEHNANLKYKDDKNKKYSHEKRYSLYDFVIESENLNSKIDFIEFGVGRGLSFKWWVSKITNSDARFYGFDTFTGLPEDWGTFRTGTFSTEGKFPEINDTRIKFIPGLFQDSLPEFLSKYLNNNRKVIHMDADLYSSTQYVLNSIFPILRKNDIIFFDEFAVPLHEFKAFTEFASLYKINYEVIGAVNNFLQIALKLI